MSASTARIAGLFRYPLKSASGEPLQTATLDERGLQGDRSWMLVRPDGRFLTQRELPQLALLRALQQGASLRLEAPGLAPLQAHPGAPCEVQVWEDRVQAWDAGEGVAAALGAWLGRPCRLVKFDPARPRYSNRQWTGAIQAETSFSDGFPLLLVNRASLADLSDRVGRVVPVERFRPNLFVEGLPAWAEDELTTLSLGGVELRLVKPCTRCSITTIDPATGQFDGEEPLRTLRGFRHDARLAGFTFGVNVVIARGLGEALAVGDVFAAR